MDQGNAEPGDRTSLAEQESKLVADILRDISALVMAATTRIGNPATVGDAAANGERIRMVTDRMIFTIEGLLRLSRQIRELMAIGPLRPREGEADSVVPARVAAVAELMTSTLTADRQRLVGPYGRYEPSLPNTGLRPHDQPPVRPGNQQQPTQQPTQPQTRPAQLVQQQPSASGAAGAAVLHPQ